MPTSHLYSMPLVTLFPAARLLCRSHVDEGEVLEVAETFVFPEYDSESQWGDIAVLRLAHAAPADLTWPIEIMPVPVKSGTTVMALGWGKQEEKDVGKHGRKVRAAGRA